MSHLLARIMLALLMIPLAAMLYVVVIVVWIDKSNYMGDDYGFLVAAFASAVFVVVYWLMLWGRVTRWTNARIKMTLGAGLVCVAIGLLVGWPLEHYIDDGFGLFVGGVVPILLWLVSTVFIWRDTIAERAARVGSTSSRAIACRTCGYNMTGLREAICPECGTRYTLDELFASQPEREQEQLSDQSPSS